MLDYAQPPVYTNPHLQTQDEYSYDTSILSKFGTIPLWGDKENNILTTFEMLGVKILDRKGTVSFLQNNPITTDNLYKTSTELLKTFNERYWTSLRLELSITDEELPELFLIIETALTPKEAIARLNTFDSWFIPNVFKDFTRFNVNIEFI